MKESKEFDRWNDLKKQINLKGEKLFQEREVWWMNFGKNVGVEINGKGNKFIRADLILRKYNRQKALVLPITSKPKSNNPFYFEIVYKNRKFYISLTQARVISNKRFVRKIYKMGACKYNEILDGFVNNLQSKTPRKARGSGA